MNFTQDEVVMTQQLLSVLSGASVSIPVENPGEKKEPVGGKLIRVRFGHVPQTRYAQLGGTRVRKYGSLLVQLCFPTGTGKGELLALADTIAAGFFRFKSGGLRCNPASYQDGVPESGFITGTVDVPYLSDYSS